MTPVPRPPRAIAVVLSLLLTSLPAAAEDAPSSIEIGFVNDVYEDLDSDLAPIRHGTLTIHVSSPEHRLTVHGNRLTLTPRADGSLDAAMEVDFEGNGHLIADVETVGRFEDFVKAPRQSARAAGVVRLTRADGGYLFTVVTADPSVRLQVVSGVVRQVVGACRLAAMLMSLPCAGLEKALAAVDVPLPGPGGTIPVPADQLSDAERAFLDRLVSGG